MSRWKLSVGLLCATLCSTSTWADDVPTETPLYGVSVGGFLSTFFGGSQSGPETPLSNTRYQDTFETGSGFRLEAFRDMGTGWRGQVGLVRSQWRGKHFVGGEFPAGAQFGDFTLTGVYLGLRYAFAANASWTPYLLGNFGLVHLSSLTVQSGTTTVPYWTGNLRDYLEFGAGVSHRLGERQAITADLRLQIFGAPKEATYPIAAATGGTSLMINVGYEWSWR